MIDKSKVLVWDVPTRVFHWLLALSFTGAFLTAESERYRDVHVLLGYTSSGSLRFDCYGDSWARATLASGPSLMVPRAC